MDYIKLIAWIDPAKALESAVELAHAGVDELHFEYKRESDLETIKEITRTIDVPMSVRLAPERFEDVKKVLYAGAASVGLMTEKEEVIKEVLGRFGAEKVSAIMPVDTLMEAPHFDTELQQLEEYEYGQVYLGANTSLLDNQELVQHICKTSELPVIIPVEEEGIDTLTLGEVLKAVKPGGLLLSAENGLRAKEFKQTFRDMGLAVNTFTSAIPFSEFKLNSDGLIPVVVQDYKTNAVLMVAYMNEASYNKTIETGQMTYYSRSRQELWLKGETSGHYQYVKSLSLDCDNDTILAKVEQVGAACHTGSYSCFFQDLVKKDYKDENPLTILKEDYEVIAERKRNPKEGSYTNYLFDKGIDKILKKVGEEATEIVIAAKNPDAEELKYEISDFLYHVMVLMVERGLTWEDITRELAERR